MKGKWTGKYWFSGKIPDVLKGRKTEFELIIDNFSNSKISGKIADNIKTGGTKGIGTIQGTVKGNKIKFVKRMPVSTAILKDGTRIEENKPHRPIYYKGIIDYKTGSIKGTWRFKIGFGLIKGRFAFFPGTYGEWEMKQA
ncbi:hypothetical protein [Flammeovirga aprica]|uniref:Uncharacterized protein n=1 Tax=Flammeovirga aprica JL-4 TaxID=694437 RepID=A0A7X9XBY8_9BACT|nr:hypothetical protein [Flammeovirga aprica]NME71247.1 hypothetical protein [Flammeovirga aprica JL-4]